MTSPLRARAVRAVAWSFLERIGQQGVQFVISIVLARLLLPEQFGLIGMLSVFIEVARSFVDSGLGAALVQRKNISRADECSVFYFNLLVGALCTCLLWAIAPWVAAFYRQPILTRLTRVLSLTLIINSFAGVQTAILSKRIDFKTLLKVGMSATVLSGAIGIGMAIAGFGVWSLVAQYLASSILRTAFLWLRDSWRPRLIFRFGALRQMLGFGSHLLASALLNRVFENIYMVVIGKLFSAAHLGLYAGAAKIQRLLIINIAAVITRVTFPVFSEIQDDTVRLKRCMRKGMMALAFVNFPLMVGLAVVARPLIYVLLTEKWAGAIPLLQLLALAGLLYPLHSLHLNLLKAKGRSDLFFRLEVIKRMLIVVLIAITYRWGVTGMIYGQIVMSILGYFINSFYTRRLIGYGLVEQLHDLAPYAVVSALMGLGLYGFQCIPSLGYGALLIGQVLFGIVIYAALSSLFGLSAFAEMVQGIRDGIAPGTISLARS